MAVYAYWCNLNIRNKFFGYESTDLLVHVGDVEATSLDDAFRKFNRIDAPVPVLDDAQAPSMSVGDVVQVVNFYGIDEWFTVESFGFKAIEPNFEDEVFIFPHHHGETAGDVIRRVVEREA